MNRWLWLGIGGFCLVAGFGMGFLYMQDPKNMVISLLMLAFFAAGVILIWKGIKGGDTPVRQEKGKAKPVFKGAANSIVFDAVKLSDGRHVTRGMRLDKIEKPEQYGTINHYCENNKRWYYLFTSVTEAGKDIATLTPYEQQDTKYIPPSILAKYLGLPGIRDAFNLHEDAMKLIGPGLLVVGMIVCFIAMVAIE